MKHKVNINYNDCINDILRISGSQNLLEEVREPTDINTKEFKKWFKNSKIVANGKPLVVYHGSTNEFNKFDKNRALRGNYGPGFYFSTNKEYSENFNKHLNKSNHIYEVYLSIQNPLVFKKNTFLQTLMKVMTNKEKNMSMMDVEPRRILAEKGYDGMISYCNGYIEIVAFEPNQIKSVYNCGRWQESSDNIFENEDTKL